MKKWYHSKTIWFNLITIALGILGAVNDVYPVDPKMLALVNGIGNVFLRFLTTQKIGFGTEPNTTSVAEEVIPVEESDFESESD